MSVSRSSAILDITEPAADGPVRLPTSRQLYGRWERQQWSVAEVGVTRDTQEWAALRPFYRKELLSALAELEVGEVCVTETLSSLVESAPTTDHRIYLCTQLADEARHVRFFQSYLTEAVGMDVESSEGQHALDATTDYAQVFAPRLQQATDQARESAEEGAWYSAVVLYHLITEGVLAATALRTTREVVRTLKLPALGEGLTNVIRDESRHVSFGLAAVREGVQNGYGDTIWLAYAAGMDLAAWVLIGPRRHNPVPVISQARRYRVAQLENHVTIARDRVLRQLRIIGLEGRQPDADSQWTAACETALDAYHDHWNTDHPLRVSATSQGANREY